MKKPKKNRLIACIVAIIILIATCSLGWFLFQKKDNSMQQVSLGEQQNQQTQQAVLQLASNLLGNANNLNQLIRKPDGSVKPIQEIEEEFLISIFSQTKSPISDISGNLSPEIIERIWWELRPWIEEYLKDLNKSILNHGQEKFLHDLEKWLRWQQKEYQHQLEEQIKEERKRLVANKGKISQLEQQKTEKENELTKLLNSHNQPELNKEQIYQEYQSRFQKIASSINNLTTEIITNLANNGYNFIKITWTGELHAPSLTSESSVSYTLQK